MRVGLIYTPLTDPTVTYHSLLHLGAHLRVAGGHEVQFLDLNTRAVSQLLTPGYVQALQVEARARMARLRCEANGSAEASGAYVDMMRVAAFNPERIAAAAGRLRSRDDFFEMGRYSDAASTISNWIEAVSGLGVPGAYTRGFDVVPTPGADPDELTTLLDPEFQDRLVLPFRDALIDELEEMLDGPKLGCIGIGITYRSQLPFALWVAGQIRQRATEVPLAVGGTEVAAVWKGTDASGFNQVFAGFDAAVLGDGETAMLALADHWGGSGGVLTENTILLKSSTPHELAFSQRIENLKLITNADYGGLRGEPILAPLPVAYYSPTRGCYWNKCTFCDYGANFDRPTAPWRQKPVPEVVAELRTLSEVTDFIYLSVDVLAPGWLKRFAQEIVDQGISISWAAELRVESRFDAEACRLLRKSGCVALSFGFESASRRILELIDKGTDPDAMRETLIGAAAAGIAIQVMGFLHFPTETFDEAMETLDYLDDIREHWSVAAIGDFMLTPKAIVAKNPEEFGLDGLAAARPGRINRFLPFPATENTEVEKAEIEKAKTRLSTALFDRPFAGGVDCAHSLLYYRQFGPEFPQRMKSEFYDAAATPAQSVARATVESAVPRQIIETAAKNKDLVLPSFALTDAENETSSHMDFVVAENGLIIPAVEEVETVFSRCLGDQPAGASAGQDGWGDLTEGFVAQVLRQNGVLRRVTT